jgi:hypothetical protein
MNKFFPVSCSSRVRLLNTHLKKKKKKKKKKKGCWEKEVFLGFFFGGFVLKLGPSSM